MNEVKVDKNVVIRPLTNLYGCTIGENSRIGTFVEIQKNVFIGKNCKIQSHSFICEGVIIEDEVFVGHGVMFCNDRYPRSTNQDGNLQSESDWVLEKTLVKKRASIGSNSTILCGLIIGENAIIGAGSVVTKNVPDNEIWAGNPAKFLKNL
jgi:acetyltransferase-like isoleucine patch superfamily enzyme